MNFVKEYNERTAAQAGQIIPVVITVYEDRSFTFVTKTPPAADLLRRAAGVDKGSGNAERRTRRHGHRDQVREIAELKMKDLNAVDLDGADQADRRHRPQHGHRGRRRSEQCAVVSAGRL